MLNEMFQSVIDQDRASVVICNLEHEIVYMNPAAVENYSKWGGAALVGKSLLNCHNQASRETIDKVMRWFMESEENNMIYTFLYFFYTHKALFSYLFIIHN